MLPLKSDQYDRAIAAFEKAIELGGRSVNHIGVLGYVWPFREPRSGERAAEELTTRAAEGYVSAMWIALMHLGLSDLEQSLPAGWTAPSRIVTVR